MWEGKVGRLRAVAMGVVRPTRKGGQGKGKGSCMAVVGRWSMVCLVLPERHGERWRGWREEVYEEKRSVKVLSCDYAGEVQRIIRFKTRSRNLALSADELPRAMTGLKSFGSACLEVSENSMICHNDI